MLNSGSTISVDSVAGGDDACCGVNGNAPCQTLSYAMALINLAQATGVTIHATIDGGGGDWAPDAESYPVILGWGVELVAPGIYFNVGPNDGGIDAILKVDFYPGGKDTSGYASIVGNTSNPIGIGMNAANSVQMQVDSAVAVESLNTLYLANANVNGSLNTSQYTSALAYSVFVLGDLVLGQDRIGTNTGPVQIGNALGQQNTDGWRGIQCQGGTVSDVVLDGGQSTVVIQGQVEFDIEISDGCRVSLSGNPVLGLPPDAGGVGTTACGPVFMNGLSGFHDRIGLQLLGGEVTFNNGIIQCTEVGVNLQDDVTDNLVVNMDNTLVRNNDIGVLGTGGGPVTLTNSTVIYNAVGVVQSTGYADSTVDLSGGGNTVACSYGPAADQWVDGPGVDVYNNTASTMNASNVAWSTPTPDYFSCLNYSGAFGCQCLVDGGCVNDAGSNGMNAVEDARYLGGVITTNNTLSLFALDAGCI